MERSARATFFATRPGGITLDRDEEGGNPFASALIELASDPALRLRELADRLRYLTGHKTDGRQVPDYVGPSELPDWGFNEELMPRREARHALVLVVSDYSGSDPSSSLWGAAWDERRISAMLAQSGFSVTQGIAPDRRSLLSAMTSFRRRSAESDVAVVYSTGHGLEADGETFLVPGDYPIYRGYGASRLKRFAVGVSQISRSAAASRLNLVFFAGCRKAPRRTVLQSVGEAAEQAGA